VPLTQQRFLAVLDEALNAQNAHLALRTDLYAVLASNVPSERKLDVIADLLDRSPAPLFLALCQRERAHVLRTRERNERARQRMRTSRQRAQNAQKGD